MANYDKFYNNGKRAVKLQPALSVEDHMILCSLPKYSIDRILFNKGVIDEYSKRNK